MKTVFLFPGQGAQYPGMAKDLYEASPSVRALFEAAGDIVKKDLARLLFQGDEEDLKVTENTQVAVTLTNISVAQMLRDQGLVADYTAGFSVGEYTALYEAGVLDLADLFRAIAIRGRVMEQVSRAYDSADGPAGMTAVLGLPFEVAAPIVQSLADRQVFVANHSSPTQIVIAGTAQGLAKAEAALSGAGAMRLVRLKVGGPVHSPLLAQAATAFADQTAHINFREPGKPVISNVTACAIASGQEARALATAQIASPVKWVDTMSWLVAHGVQRILELGPGKVLAGLWKSFTKDSKCQSIGTVGDIRAILSEDYLR